ncbi:MAG: extracellular solute-binding protein [Lachnospiraceae bacterium]|nr:extracellular solute-binding protein [Lachnospiraceae bacterium]
MKRRIFTLILCTSIFTASLSGCAKENTSQKENGEKVKIIFSEHLADIKSNAPQVYNIVQAFNAANPDIEVVLEGQASDEHTTQMKLAAQTNSLPDIFYLLSGDAKEMADAGYLADISEDILNDQEFVDSFLPGMLESMKIGDCLYGIPAEMFVNGIWYNKALFDQNNLSIPVTFDDMLNCAQVLKENGIIPMARGTKDVFSCWATWTMHCRYGFYDHIDGIINGTDKWNNPDYKKFYQMIEKMAKAEMFPENMITMGYDEAQQMFASGQAAMFDSGVWDTAQFEQSDFADSIGFWWGPQFSDGIGNQKISMKAPSHPYCISAKTKEESPEKYEACIRFLKFYYGKEGTQIIVDSNCVPVTKYDGEIDQEQFPVYANIMAAINDDWESPLICPNVYVGTFETTYFESITGVLNGVYTPEEAMDFLDEQSEIQGLVKKQ